MSVRRWAKEVNGGRNPADEASRNADKSSRRAYRLGTERAHGQAANDHDYAWSMATSKDRSDYHDRMRGAHEAAMDHPESAKPPEDIGSWDESKHPRRKDGKFAPSKGAK